MGRSAFIKDIVRSIRGSMGRFLAIMGIVALGCGFYAGLQMCGPNMRADADALYDGTNLWDLRLISTLGFGDADVARIKAVEGVDQAMPSLTCDAMARLGSEQVAVRISSLDPAQAEASRAEGLYAVASDDAAYLNRPRLVEGDWPRKKGECVISADVPRESCGIGDTIELLYGTSDLSSLLCVSKLVVVGTVSSSNYPYTGSFGSTTLGSGMIDQYLFVAPASLAEDAPFTEVYLTVDGAAEQLSESDEYEQVVGATKSRLEGMQDEFARERQADLKRLAQDKLDEKWDEYHTEKQKADAELADAKAKLDDGAAQIAEGEQELADGEAQYQEGLAEFGRKRDEALQQLDDAEAEIDRNQSLLNQKRAEAESGARQLDEAEKKLNEAEAQLGMTQADIDAAAAELAQGEEQWNAQREPLATADECLTTCIDAVASVSELAQTDGTPSQEEVMACVNEVHEAVDAAQTLMGLGLFEIEDQAAAAQLQGVLAMVQGILARVESGDGAALEQALAQLKSVDPATFEQAMAAASGARDQVEAGIAQGDAAMVDARDKLAQAQAARAQIDAGRAEVEQGRRQLVEGAAQMDEGQRQIDAGRRQLQEGRATADRELRDAQAQLDEAAAKLEEGRAELRDARIEYADGLRSYEEGKAEANEKFGDALAQLQDAQKEIDEIELPDIYALDRTQSEGAATYHADAGRIDAIADVFPFIFFLVAALVSLTTMTRMVEDDRVLIGTYKALGYGTAAIAAKYLVYAGIAGVVGATVGIVALSQVLPFIVMSAYSIIYTVPIHPFPLPIYPSIALAAGGLGVGVCLLATWGAVVSSLREVPATLMLPRAPKAGKRILLERVTPVWSRLSFTWKVTFRNLFRYKRRFLMTVIGISGCTALLLVGFGLHDAIWDIIDRQYGPIIHFDTTVGLDDNAIELDVRRVSDYLERTGEVSGIVRVQNENMQAGAQGFDETIRVNVVVPRDVRQMAGAITFKNRLTGEALAFDDDSVLVTEKLAMKYGLSAGDAITLFDQDEVGNAVGDGHQLVITGVAENYVGNLVYVGRNAWRSVSTRQPVFSTIYASTTPDEKVRASIAEELHDMEDVSTVIFSDETINMYRKMLSVVDMIVVVLIVSAAALAYIVLYNLTNINIGERIREIASLKVLGFTRMEVYTYIFREIGLLAVMGDVVGMVLGIFLERFVVTTAEVDYVMFGRSIHAPSFAYAFALTLVFTALVIASMRRKLDRVDMVESLKSID